MSQFLDFEKPLAELQNKISELREYSTDNVDFTSEIQKFEKKAERLKKEIYSNLTRWQRTQLARHAERPYTLDYIERIFTDWFEIHGDRNYRDDPALVCGFARIDGQPCCVIGHQKGRNTKEKVHRNFGMPNPEGYRKALRVMQLSSSVCRFSPLSIPRGLFPVSVPRNVDKLKRLPEICVTWRP